MFDHVNNSGFWVMGQFFHLDTKQSLKYVTLPTCGGVRHLHHRYRHLQRAGSAGLII